MFLFFLVFFLSTRSQKIVSLHYYPSNSNEFWIVCFYDEKYVDYKRFMSMYVDASLKMYGNSDVKFGKVDCANSYSFCENENTEKLPVLKIFYRGYVLEYGGYYGNGLLEQWVKDCISENGTKIRIQNSLPPIKRSENVIELDATHFVPSISPSNEFWLVIYYRDNLLKNNNFTLVFNEVADKFRLNFNGQIKFGRLLCPISKNLGAVSPNKHRELYTYLKGFAGAAYVSAREMLPEVIRIVKPKSVCDLGCSTGAWVRACQEIGGIAKEDAVGFDLEFPLENLEIDPSQYRNTDLSQPFVCERKFDLAISLQVIDHILVSNEATYMRSIVSMAPVVLFASSIPNQPFGKQHINEHWPEYWQRRFEKYHYYPVDCLRLKFWNNNKINRFYRQNTVLFMREDKLSSLGFEKSNEPLLSLVHPIIWSEIFKKGEMERIKRRVDKEERIGTEDLCSQQNLREGETAVDLYHAGLVAKYTGVQNYDLLVQWLSKKLEVIQGGVEGESLDWKRIQMKKKRSDQQKGNPKDL